MEAKGIVSRGLSLFFLLNKSLTGRVEQIYNEVTFPITLL